MNFVNLTPHAITVRLNDGSDLTFPPSGKIARVDEMPNVHTGDINGIPIMARTVFGEVIDLPEPTEGIGYIVSGLVAGVVYRADVFAPATGPKDNAIRNEKGHIIAVVALKATTNGISSGVVIC